MISLHKKSTMNKLFNILLFTILSIVARAQDEKISHRVMLTSDSIPIFGKNYSALHFGHSFFFTESKFSNQLTSAQVNKLSSDLKNAHLGISLFQSASGNELAIVFTKESTRAVGNFKQFLTDYFTNNGIPMPLSYTNKHIQVASEYGEKDQNKGFN